MPDLDRDGIGVFYKRTGSGDGTPILMTHGFCAASQMFEANLEALAPSRLCLAWDIRGHGASDSPGDPSAYSVGHSIADMAAILDAEALDRVILLGHSLGGYLSLEFARTHAERVAGLVLVDTGPGFRSEKSRAGWNRTCESFAVSLEKHGLEGLPAGNDEMRPEWHRDAKGLVLAARGILTQHDSRVLDHLPHITVPALVVVGERDATYLAGASYMAAKIPDARQVVVAGAGHAPMLTHPRAFEAEIQAFLAEVDSRVRGVPNE